MYAHKHTILQKWVDFILAGGVISAIFSCLPKIVVSSHTFLPPYIIGLPDVANKNTLLGTKITIK